MESFNIINNLDQEILMENLLITNQQKLLDLLIDLFTHQININLNVPIEITYIKQIINSQKFINWTTFINLINLNTTFKHKKRSYNSLTYIIEKKCIKLIKFLLELDSQAYLNSQSNQINWETTNPYTLTNCIGMIIISYCDDLAMIKFLMDLGLNQNNDFKKLYMIPNKYLKTPMDYLIEKCDESIVIYSIEKNLLSLDWTYNNMKILKNPEIPETLERIACELNWTNLLKMLINVKIPYKNNKLDDEFYELLNIACTNGNLECVEILINSIKIEDLCGKKLETIFKSAIMHSPINIIELLISLKHIEFSNDLIYFIFEHSNSIKIIKFFISNNILDLTNIDLFKVNLLLAKKNLFVEAIGINFKFFLDWLYNGNYDYDMNSNTMCYLNGHKFNVYLEESELTFSTNELDRTDELGTE